MILIYAHKSTSRLRYTLNLVFRDVIQTPFKLTSNPVEFNLFEGAKLSYGLHALETEFYVQSKTLLFENGIVEQDIVGMDALGTKAFFGTSSRSDFPFDIFAASFYLASRYEEYLPHKRDEHDRFEAEQSIASQLDFLSVPVINRWCLLFWNTLKNKFPDLSKSGRKYQFITSIDIDNAYSIKEKGFVRTTAGLAKDLLSFDIPSFKTRIKVLSGNQKDPYDTFDYQLEIIKKHKLKFIYFFLLGDYGQFDKNIPINNLKFRSLIKTLGDYAQIGIHPSYGSNNDFLRLQKEVNRLSPVLNREITQSRQHFLRLKLPDTYRNLIEADILHDHTMGYATHYGFRAGICTPYYFYDLDLEVETQLQIHPFAIMEGTLKYHLHIDPENAFEHYKKLIDEVKQVNGTFISLWHNDTLSNQGLWEGWRAVFEQMIEYGKA